jgi:hypothetical protein
LNWLVQHKEIDPFANYSLCSRFDQFLKVAVLCGRQRRTPWHWGVTDFLDQPIDHNDFSSHLMTLVLAVDMNRLMLVGVEHDHDTEIFIKFGHNKMKKTPDFLENFSATSSGPVASAKCFFTHQERFHCPSIQTAKPVCGDGLPRSAPATTRKSGSDPDYSDPDYSDFQRPLVGQLAHTVLRSGLADDQAVKH